MRSRNRLYDGVALVGVIMVFGGPVALLFAGAQGLAAATLGYMGIALFVGGISARYGVIEHHRPVIQLSLNLIVSVMITCLFYAAFMILYGLQ